MTVPSPNSHKEMKPRNWEIDEHKPYTSDPKLCNKYFGSINPHIIVTISVTNDIIVLILKYFVLR